MIRGLGWIYAILILSCASIASATPRCPDGGKGDSSGNETWPDIYSKSDGLRFNFPAEDIKIIQSQAAREDANPFGLKDDEIRQFLRLPPPPLPLECFRHASGFQKLGLRNLPQCHPPLVLSLEQRYQAGLNYYIATMGRTDPRANDPSQIYLMVQSIYEQCPLEGKNNTVLIDAGKRYQELAKINSVSAEELQHIHFWMAMAYASQAETYDRMDRDFNGNPGNALSALTEFVEITDPDLRAQGRSETDRLRLRSARRQAYIAYHVRRDGRNISEDGFKDIGDKFDCLSKRMFSSPAEEPWDPCDPEDRKSRTGWPGASQRLRCFLSEYADLAGDGDIHRNLRWLRDDSKRFIQEREKDARYNLTGMRALHAQLNELVSHPAAPPNKHWPTKADIDPADPDNLENCLRRPSPIPDADAFEFDLSRRRAKRDRWENRRLAAEAARDAAVETAGAPLPDPPPDIQPLPALSQ